MKINNENLYQLEHSACTCKYEFIDNKDVLVEEDKLCFLHYPEECDKSLVEAWLKYESNI